MSKEFTYDKNKDDELPFYYYYRSESEKHELHNKFCDNIRFVIV